ncbi:MAG: FMN-binding glutamate synthase family protein [Deltaproteobacteria bacterium]|nr:MAG: FMN-binding glutamate synthase family protein [Deltaproteobacteria bacterium]
MDRILQVSSEHWLLSTLLGALTVLCLVALYDVLQRRHTILHNFPIVGHLRYWLETIGPELRQYWVAGDKEEQPFNRDERAWVYASAKGENNTFGFGTTELLYGIGYPIIKHAAFPFPESQAFHPEGDPTAIPCLKILGETHDRQRAFRPRSIVNISAMSFGSLGARAITALNIGARMAGCLHNTGEGAISPYHLNGGDLVWQIGTGYFGARDENGFSLDVVAARVAEHPVVRAIEIKLSQGAKPGKGGILPASKVTPEIAAIRGVPPGQDCISPNAHSEFSTVDELIDFVEAIAACTGLPVGIKSAVGEAAFWRELAERMKARRQGPDFISIDGAEGGTGAAPLTFADHVALPWKIGFQRAYTLFQAEGMASRVVWIGSAKLGFPDRAMVAFAMGCDLIQVAREAMLSIGCIQALKCHTGHCPAGVATQSRWLQAGLDVEGKAERFARYIRALRKELLALAHAAGYEHPCQIGPDDVEFSTGVNQFSTLVETLGYRKDPVPFEGMASLFEDAAPRSRSTAGASAGAGSGRRTSLASARIPSPERSKSQ